MFEILEVTAPFFALILCGYLAARLRLLPEKSVPALNTFVLYFALLARFVVGESARDAVYGGLAAAWSNWGYMGFALLPAVPGPQVLPIVVAAGSDLLIDAQYAE
jgi:predicted permease